VQAGGLGRGGAGHPLARRRIAEIVEDSNDHVVHEAVVVVEVRRTAQPRRWPLRPPHRMTVAQAHFDA